VDQGHGLVPRIGSPRRLPQVDVSVQQTLQAEVLGEGGREQQARIRDQVVVIETDVEPVQGVR